MSLSSLWVYYTILDVVRLRDGDFGIPNPEFGSKTIQIQNVNLNWVIGFGLNLPQHQHCTCFHHIKG